MTHACPAASLWPTPSPGCCSPPTPPPSCSVGRGSSGRCSTIGASTPSRSAWRCSAWPAPSSCARGAPSASPWGWGCWRGPSATCCSPSSRRAAPRLRLPRPRTPATSSCTPWPTWPSCSSSAARCGRSRRVSGWTVPWPVWARPPSCRPSSSTPSSRRSAAHPPPSPSTSPTRSVTCSSWHLPSAPWSSCPAGRSA